MGFRVSIMKNFKIAQHITDRQDASLSLYFKDVSKIPLLTPEEEKKLTALARNGDRKAINKLIESNLRFVISVAKQYQGKGVPLVDLIQEGTVGLIQAAQLFNPDKEIKFISYAVWWIRAIIIKALTEQSRTVRLPMSQVVCINKINKASEKLEQLNERKPSPEELENEVKIESSKISDALTAYNHSVSLESPFNSDDVSCLLDVIPNDAESTDKLVSEGDLTNRIETLLSKLSYRDSDVLRMTYGIGMQPMPNDEIANRFGIGSERVRQIQHSAIKYIRKHYSKELKKLL